MAKLQTTKKIDRTFINSFKEHDNPRARAFARRFERLDAEGKDDHADYLFQKLHDDKRNRRGWEWVEQLRRKD